MNQTTALKKFILLLFTLSLVGSALAAQDKPPAPRFFDTAPAAYQGLRLVVCHPSTGSIRDLMALKAEGFLDFDNLTVIGVYHLRERTDYADAEKFARENGLGWLKFHGVPAPISEQDLFRQNACSPEFEEIFKKSDGLIFFGGPDIPPYIYKEKTRLLTEISDPYRHFFELSFIFHLLGGSQDESFKGLMDSRPAYPILGICLGAQSLNVGTGGSLTQDIWAQIYGKENLEDIIALGPDQWHTNPYARLYPDLQLFPYKLHHIILKGAEKFVKEWDFDASDRPLIMSAHHQQVNRTGKGFRVIATSLDAKIAEAFDHEKFPNVLAVQFHPEFPELWDGRTLHKMTPDDETGVTIRSILEKNPPSLGFHQKLWGWFNSKLRAGRHL